MRNKLTFITGLSLAFMLLGFYLAITHNESFLGRRVFFTLVGILGLFIGSKLNEIESRLATLEQKTAPDTQETAVAHPHHPN